MSKGPTSVGLFYVHNAGFPACSLTLADYNVSTRLVRCPSRLTERIATAPLTLRWSVSIAGHHNGTAGRDIQIACTRFSRFAAEIVWVDLRREGEFIWRFFQTGQGEALFYRLTGLRCQPGKHQPDTAAEIGILRAELHLKGPVGDLTAQCRDAQGSNIAVFIKPAGGLHQDMVVIGAASPVVYHSRYFC